MINLKIYYLFFLLLLAIALSFSTYIVSSSPVEKVTLVRFAELVWIKVEAQIPQTLMATRECDIALSIKVIEVDGTLRRLFIKGIRITIGDGYVEYVPDKPLEFKRVGDEVEVVVKVSPRVFASNLAPGDVKETVVKVDFAYYVEGADVKGDEVIEAGLYTVFGNIPVRIIVPKTYVYVQPEVNVTYEPSYIINFTVRVWIEGEGYVENVRVEIKDVPVQCYLLTTGKMSVGESKVLWTVMNVTKLGILVQEEYDGTVTVTAITPWGYIYEYDYPLKLKLLKVRRVTASVPNRVIAYAYTPISLSLTPKPEKGEVVRISVSLDGKRIYTTTYPAQYLPLATESGVVKLTLSSDLQAPTFITQRVEVDKVSPSLSVTFSPRTKRVRVEVKPLFVNSRVLVAVTDEDKNTVFIQSISDASLSKRATTVNGVLTALGYTSITIPELKPGKYTIKVEYNTPLGSTSQSVKYVVKETSVIEQVSSYLSFIPIPKPFNLILIVAIVVFVVTSLIIALRRKRVEEENSEL